ncbi:MAG TPA: NAD(P)-dependent oxidoreductase [Pseudonocardiaceae bacterium]|jgi:3-hydroxyisobutyrate dehydrogenase-like beta-hydroxyacid dehydrogenase|nr:NAD(P)-dependent oxidoreductase [Pseudonocardiaceae bacterium]
MNQPRIGLIGLGGMGTALGSCLLAAGYPLHCHDARPEPVSLMVARGAGALPTARALAQACDVVFTFLPGPAEVESVALDPETGVLAGLAPGAAMFDLSTCAPDTAQRIGDAFDAAGRTFVDCPVSRKPPEMTVLVGGAPGALGAAEPVLAHAARTIIHTGRRGAGYAVKLLNQHVKYAWYLASTEALLIARAYGVDPALAADAIQQSSGGESGLSTAAKYFLGDTEGMATHAPTRTIDKDMRLAQALAESVHVESPTLDVVAEAFATLAGTPYRDRPYPEGSELITGLRIGH